MKLKIRSKLLVGFWDAVEAQISELESEFLLVRQVLENEVQMVNQ